MKAKEFYRMVGSCEPQGWSCPTVEGCVENVFSCLKTVLGPDKSDLVAGMLPGEIRGIWEGSGSYEERDFFEGEDILAEKLEEELDEAA